MKRTIKRILGDSEIAISYAYYPKTESIESWMSLSRCESAPAQVVITSILSDKVEIMTKLHSRVLESLTDEILEEIN